MRVKENYIRDFLRLIVWFPFRWFFFLLPLNGSFLSFKLMGNLHYLFARTNRQRLIDRVSRNIGVSRGQASGFVKKYFQLHYLDRLHIFLYPRLVLRNNLFDIVHIENIEMLTSLINHQQGVLIVQPHFGPVQMTLLTLSLYGFNPIQIGFPSDRGLSKIGRKIAFKYRLQYEKKLPAPIISADGYLGKAYKHLLHGGIVLTTGDGAGGKVYLGEHKKYNFLENERNIPLGPASMAIKTGATFLPTFIIPEKYNHLKIIFETPIRPKYNDLELDKVYMMEKFISIAEKYIEKYPYCWHFWDEVQDNK